MLYKLWSKRLCFEASGVLILPLDVPTLLAIQKQQIFIDDTQEGI